VSQIVGAPHFTIARIREVSEEAVTLAQWVIDVVMSHKVFQDIKFRTPLDTPQDERPVKLVEINHPMPRSIPTVGEAEFQEIPPLPAQVHH